MFIVDVNSHSSRSLGREAVIYMSATPSALRRTFVFRWSQRVWEFGRGPSQANDINAWRMIIASRRRGFIHFYETWKKATRTTRPRREWWQRNNEQEDHIKWNCYCILPISSRLVNKSTYDHIEIRPEIHKENERWSKEWKS